MNKAKCDCERQSNSPGGAKSEASSSISECIVIPESVLNELCDYAGKVGVAIASRKDNKSRAEFIKELFPSGYPIDIADEFVISDAVTAKANEFVRLLLHCEDCDRVWIQTSPGQDSYQSYTSIDGETHSG